MEATMGVALYARVSSQRQADELTIGSQVSALRQRIQQDGLKVEEDRCFLDEGYSGTTLLRPALERLRDLVHCGVIDRLYVHSPDRLARKYVYQMLLLEEFSRQSVEVIFLNHDPQDRSAEANLLLQVQGMIAEYERAKILERTRRGRRFAAQQGKLSVMGHAPYGYRYVPKQQGEGDARYEIVADDARIVREIFSWVGVEGLSLVGVVVRLAERGIPTVTGKRRWDPATVRGILLNPAYTGTAKYGKTRLVQRTEGRRPKRGDPPTPRQEKVTQATLPEEQESIPVPALVSGDLFAAVAERLEENRRRHREQKQGSEFLLGGLLVCQRCGSAYCGRRHRQGKRCYVYYRCIGTDKYRHAGEPICASRGVSGTALEAVVWSDVCSLLQDPGRLHRELERRLQRSSPEEADAPHRLESIAKLKRRLGRLVDAYENGWLEKDELQLRIGRVKERLAREQEAYAQSLRDATSEEELRLIVGQFETFAQQIASGLRHADTAAKRKLLRLLIKQIEIDDVDVRIVYKVQPHPFVLSPNRGILQDCLKCHSTAQGAGFLFIATTWVTVVEET
jgi:site-specific DNA recombinase